MPKGVYKRTDAQIEYLRSRIPELTIASHTPEVNARRRETCLPMLKDRAIDIPPAYVLYNMYYVQKMSTVDIARHFGVVNTTVGKWLRHHDLDTRPIGEAVSIAQTGKKHSKEWNDAIGNGNRGKQRTAEQRENNSKAQRGKKLSPEHAAIFGKWNLGRRFSEEHCRKISNALRGKNKDWMVGTIRNSNGRYNTKSGYRESIGMYVRSSWEHNYCLYLDFIKKHGVIKSWEYEPDVFIFHKIELGTRSYTPDFKVTNKDGSIEYHEVKGYMDPKSKVKLKRMAKYYPDVKIVLVDKKAYAEIRRQVAGLIPFWEGER